MLRKCFYVKISKLKEIYLPLNIQMFAQRKSWIEKNNTSLSYNDVTTEWLKNTNPNSHKVLDAKYFVFKKNKYIVDGINVILDYSKKEKEGILVANKYTFFDNPCDINYFFILLIILKMVRKSRGSNYFNTIFFTLLFPAKNLTYIPYHPL